MSGPLAGVRVVELTGLGPAPFAGMILADLGADVVLVDRPGPRPMVAPRFDVSHRGKRSIIVDLKSAQGTEVVLDLIASADALIEGFRPGVTERLGIGPAKCLARNPALTYGRMTGWGQAGPLASTAGHDIDYIAVSGALGSIGTPSSPVPPLNLIGDFGGGGMLLVVGVLAAIVSARATGEGQVVDAAMVDGSALLMASHHGFAAEGWWGPRRGTNLLDGAAPFYRVYETADGSHVAVGALEPQFFAALLDGLGVDPADVGEQHDRDNWARMRDLFSVTFATRTRDDWAERFAGTDACVAPVLSMAEAPEHVHNVVRGTFTSFDGVTQPAPAPRFSRTPAHIDAGPALPGTDTDDVLSSLGYDDNSIGSLRRRGVVA